MSISTRQTVAPTAVRTISSLEGPAEVSYGDEHTVFSHKRPIAVIEHSVRDVEAGSVLYEAETWTAHRYDNPAESVGNVQSFAAAVRVSVSMWG